MIVYEYVNLEGKTVGIDNLDDKLEILGPEAIKVVSRGTHVMKMVKQEPTPKDTKITKEIANKALRDCGFRNLNPITLQAILEFLTSFTRFGLKSYVNAMDASTIFATEQGKYAYYVNNWFGMLPVEWEQKEVAVDSGNVKNAEVYVGEEKFTEGHYFSNTCPNTGILVNAVGYWRWSN